MTTSIAHRTASLPARGGAVPRVGSLVAGVARWWLSSPERGCALVAVTGLGAWGRGSFVAVLAVLVVLVAPGIAALLVSRPVVESVTEPDALTAGLSARWAAVSRSLGLGWAPSPEVWRPAPYRLTVEPDGSSALLTVAVPPGRSRADVLAAGDALAPMLRAHVLVPVGAAPTRVTWRAVLVDVLREPVTAPEPSAFGPVPIGRLSDASEWEWDPYRVVHIAVQGQTDSGKSSTVYTMLAGLAARADVVVCGVDNSGITLGPWRAGRGGAWIACGTGDMMAHARALQAIVAEMDRRIDLLTAMRKDKLDRPTADLPLLVVACEEWPGILSAARAEDALYARKTGEKALGIIQSCKTRLVNEGRKVNIGVLTLAQRMSSGCMDTDERSQYGCRMSHRVDSSEAVRMLHDGSPVDIAAMRQWLPGTALVEAPGLGQQIVRMYHTTYETYLERVDEGIAAMAGVEGLWSAGYELEVVPDADDAAETDVA